MQTQKEAVYTAVMNVLESEGLEFEKGQIITELVDDKMRASVHAILVEGFKAGEISLKQTEENQKKLKNSSELSSYVSGLISNWFRKDTRLNGGGVYKPKNPGSRAGHSNPTIKALRQLLKTGLSTDQATKVQSELDIRIKEFRAAKQKDVEIDYSALPEGLVEELELDI
jgi:hypothetical protein